MKYGDKQWKSAVLQEGGKTPKWTTIENQCIEVRVTEELNKVSFQLYDEDTINDDFIGEGHIDLLDKEILKH